MVWQPDCCLISLSPPALGVLETERVMALQIRRVVILAATAALGIVGFAGRAQAASPLPSVQEPIPYNGVAVGDEQLPVTPVPTVHDSQRFVDFVNLTDSYLLDPIRGASEVPEPASLLLLGGGLVLLGRQWRKRSNRE